MSTKNAVAEHHSIGNLLGRIENGLKRSGATPGSVSVDKLSLVDEFHIGGRDASEHFFARLGFLDGDHVLDVGCGIGGGARFGVTVTGIDVTPDYVNAGVELNRWVGLEDQVKLIVGDAMSIKFADGTYDSAYTMHVLMNVKDKEAVFREVARVLKTGAVFGIYDVMKMGEGDVRFPVPWASEALESCLASPKEYVAGLKSARFTVEEIVDRGEFAVGFFEKVSARMQTTGAPPLGIHLLMGENASVKINNLTGALVGGVISPFEIICRKS